MKVKQRKHLYLLIIIGIISIFFVLNSFTSPTDMGSVKIGTQVWATKNLDVSTFRNGDSIREAETTEEWKQADNRHQPAWCYYDGDKLNNGKHDKLYNWYAVNDSRGLAPQGWHIPSDDEWNVLVNYLGSETAGRKLKNSTGWDNNGNGDNTSGFSALPKGFRGDQDKFYLLNKSVTFWSSTSCANNLVSSRGLVSFDSHLISGCGPKGYGYSCRCIKD